MQESRIFQEELFQKVNSIANLPNKFADFLFGNFYKSQFQEIPNSDVQDQRRDRQERRSLLISFMFVRRDWWWPV